MGQYGLVGELLYGALNKRVVLTSRDNNADLRRNRTLFTSSTGLEHAKGLIVDYKKGKVAEMTPELWTAKKTIDSTLHPGSYHDLR